MRHRGFSFVEILTALTIGAVVGAILLAGIRWVHLSSERISRVLLARERGERVLSFLEPRVLHAGLGLASCRSGEALRRSFGKGMSGAPLIASWPLAHPLQVYKESPGLWPQPAKDEGGVFRGSGLCLLYAVPSGVVLAPPGGGPLSLTPGDEESFSILSGNPNEAALAAGRFRDLRSWISLPLSGYPFHLARRSGAEVSLRLSVGAPGSVEVFPWNEVFLMRCERFRVMNDTLYFQELRNEWYPPAFQPREDGVLALWVEWRPAPKVLDLWVLTSGGPAVFGPASRSSSWPAEAPWRREFERHETYVSRASWRTENL